jgi:hypothetical protein
MAMRTTLTARQASTSNGKAERPSALALGVTAARMRKMARLAAARVKPISAEAAKAQRQEIVSAARAPRKGPAKAETPQITDVMAKSWGQIVRGKSRSTETKASATRAPPPKPSSRRPSRNHGMEAATPQTIQPPVNSKVAITMLARKETRETRRPLAAPAMIEPVS